MWVSPENVYSGPSIGDTTKASLTSVECEADQSLTIRIGGIRVNSSNQSDKKLSGPQDETTEPTTTDAPAFTRPTDTPSPHVRADRTHSERAGFPDDRSAVVRALSGLLHALVQDDTESSTSTAIDGTTIDESTAYTERTASKGEYGSRTEPVDGVYGHTADGDLVVAPTG